MISVSRKGMEPTGLVSSVVNCVKGLMELMYFRNLSLCTVFCMTKVSSTYLLHTLEGLFDVLITLVSESSI